MAKKMSEPSIIDYDSTRPKEIREIRKGIVEKKFAERLEENAYTPEDEAHQKEVEKMVDDMFERSKQIPTKEFDELVLLSDLQALIAFFEKINEDELESHGINRSKNLTRIVDVLKKRVSGFDNVTELPNRDSLSDDLKQDIVEILKSDDHDRMSHLGLVYFDGRGLKMVNDASKSHKVGDQYLRRIAEGTKKIAETTFKAILGDDCDLKVYRDGGDEFAIYIRNSKLDLEKPMDIAMLNSIISDNLTIKFNGPDINVKEIALSQCEWGADGEDSQIIGCPKLIEVLGKILQYALSAQDASDILTTETIEKHLKRGNAGYKNEALKDFKMTTLVAVGSETFEGALKKPKGKAIKDLLPASEMDAKALVDNFLSIIRLSADHKSYEEKNAQTFNWQTSYDSFAKLLIDLISRNEITVAHTIALEYVEKELEINLQNHENSKEAYEKLLVYVEMLRDRVKQYGSKDRYQKKSIREQGEKIIQLESDVKSKDKVIEDQNREIAILKDNNHRLEEAKKDLENKLVEQISKNIANSGDKTFDK